MRTLVAGAARVAHRGARAVLSPLGLRGVAVEGVWVAAHLALYPLGVLGERARLDGMPASLDGVPLVQRSLLAGDPAAAGTPILLVHGMVDNRSIFTLLRRDLRRRGFGRVVTMNYSVLTADVRTAADALARRVEDLCTQTGYDRVHVVGHSLGGLVARYYVQRLGGDARVHTLVTLGSPHGGTHVARLFPAALARQCRPESKLVAELAEPAPDCQTRFLAVWSDLDQLVVPKRAARIDHPDLAARNVLLRGIGHMSLPVDRRVVREVVSTLTVLDDADPPIRARVGRPAPDTRGRRQRSGTG